MCASSVTVAVTGFGGLDNPEPGTPVARALRLGGPSRLRIEALSYDPWATGAWAAGVVDSVHLIPPLVAGGEAIFARLLQIHRDRRLDVLIPCLDLEVPVVSRLAPRLRDAGIRTLVPGAEQIDAVRKVALPHLCYRHGIVAPRTVHVADISQVPFYAGQLGFPLVVKGTVAGAKIVESADQAAVEAARLNLRWGGGALLQQTVRGDEYVVAMVARGDGTCVGSVPVRKLGVNQRGKSVVGAVVNDPDLDREAQRILACLNWRGPIELEFIRAHGSGRLNLIEINCRFPSWILLSHWAKCNLPALLLKEILHPGSSRTRRARAGTSYVRDVHEASLPAAQVLELDRHRHVSLAKPVNGHIGGRALRRGSRPMLRVGVSGISAFEVVMPGLGVARSLRQTAEITAVIGLGYGPFDTGIHRRDLFDRVVQLDEPADHERLLRRLLSVRDSVGLDVIIPCLDFEIAHFAALAPRLKENGIATLLPSADALRRMRKQHLFNGAVKRKNWGAFQIPRTIRIWTLQGVDRATRALGLPLVLKGPESGAVAAYSADDARTLWMQLKERGQPESLAQSFVYGDEFAVAGVCDHEHRLRASVAIKKIVRCERGNTWGAVEVDLPALVHSFAEFLHTMKWTGPVEGEFIRDAFSERFALIEVNPRFPAWIGYSADIGINLPRHAAMMALGREVSPLPRRRDLVFLRSSEEVEARASAFAAFATRGWLGHDRRS